MKEPIRAIAGGVTVGIANVIPGVSGGTMMAIMNIFDRTMSAISNVTKRKAEHRGRDILFLLEVVVGVVIGILGAVTVLGYLSEHVPMPLTFWFVGLVALSIPVFKKTQMKGVSIQPVSLILGAALVLALTVVNMVFFPEEAPQIDPVTGEEIKQTLLLPEFNPIDCAKLAAAGAISGFAMLLPGVSGSLVLMILGLYEYVWYGYIRNVTMLLTDFSLDTVIKFIPAGFFAIGVVIGIVLSAKITAFAMKKSKRHTLSFILGLIAASVASIVCLNLNVMVADVWQIVGSVVAFAFGGVIVWLLGKVTKDSDA